MTGGERNKCVIFLASGNRDERNLLSCVIRIPWIDGAVRAGTSNECRDKLLEFVPGKAPYALVLDFQIPGENLTALDLVRFVRNQANFSEMPILMISNLDSPELRIALDELRCSFFKKPLGPELEKIYRYLVSLW